MGHESKENAGEDDLLGTGEFVEWLNAEIYHDPEEGGSVFEALDDLDLDDPDVIQALYLIYLKGAGRFE